MNNKGAKLFLVSILSLGIISCSGGGSDSPPEQEPVNQKPTANAGADQTVDEQTTVTIQGSGTDSDGSIASYSWEQTSGPQISLSNTSQQNLEFTAPVAKQATNLEFTLTVTDNDGATGSDLVVITINPVTEQKTTLQGTIIDAPIANADVTAEIMGRVFTTKADLSGNFSVVLEFDEDENLGQELVTLTASGVGEQSHIRLKTLVDSFGNIVTQAGDDSILTADENISVNISYVSTALLAQQKYHNNDVIPLSLEQTESNAIKLDGEAIMGMAVAMKFIVDYGSTNPEAVLPEGVANTWELVANMSTFRGYLAGDFSGVSEDNIKTAKNEIGANADLITPYKAVPSFYMHTSGDMLALGEYYEFLPGEQSIYILREHTHNGTWFNDGIELYVTLPENKVVEVIDEFKTNYYVKREKIFEQKKIGLIKSYGKVDIVLEKTDGYYHYPDNPEFFDQDFEVYQIAVMTKEAEPITNEEIIGQIMLPLSADFLINTETRDTTNFGTITNTITNRASSFELTSLGMAYNNLPQLGNGVWSINESGRLELTLSGAVLEVIKITDNYVGVIVKDTSMNYRGFLTGNTAVRNVSNLWTVDNVAGFYELEGDLSTPELDFVLYLKEDNTGYQASGYDANGDGVADSYEYGIFPVYWELQSGKVIVERYRNLFNQSCVPDVSVPDCFVFNRRVIDLFAIEGDYYYATNRHSFNYHPLFNSSDDPELLDFWYFEQVDVRRWKKYQQPPLQF